jgi:hypothetical protein
MTTKISVYSDGSKAGCLVGGGAFVLVQTGNISQSVRFSNQFSDRQLDSIGDINVAEAEMARIVSEWIMINYDAGTVVDFFLDSKAVEERILAANFGEKFLCECHLEDDFFYACDGDWSMARRAFDERFTRRGMSRQGRARCCRCNGREADDDSVSKEIQYRVDEIVENMEMFSWNVYKVVSHQGSECLGNEEADMLAKSGLRLYAYQGVTCEVEFEEGCRYRNRFATTGK